MELRAGDAALSEFREGGGGYGGCGVVSPWRSMRSICSLVGLAECCTSSLDWTRRALGGAPMYLSCIHHPNHEALRRGGRPSRRLAQADARRVTALSERLVFARTYCTTVCRGGCGVGGCVDCCTELYFGTERYGTVKYRTRTLFMYFTVVWAGGTTKRSDLGCDADGTSWYIHSYSYTVAVISLLSAGLS